VATCRPQMISTLNRPFWALKMTTAPWCVRLYRIL